jgi:hypothetical protein
VNPYESAPAVPPPCRSVRLLAVPSRKRIAWNASVALLACILYADSYSRFTPSLTRVLTSRFDDIYAVAAIARLGDLLTPLFLLFAFTTVFFSKRGMMLRLVLLLPVFSILFHVVPPRIGDFVSLSVYLLLVSSILTTGLGWPALARDCFRRSRGSFIPEPDCG